MLVLTLKRGQRLLLGADVEVVIVGIEGRRTKIGIAAPKQIAIMRSKKNQDAVPLQPLK